MKKQLLIALLLLQAGNPLWAQTKIVQWNFNSSFGAIPANGTAPAPSLGSGTLMLTGGVKASDVAGVNINNVDPGNPNRAMSTTSYPLVSSSPQSAGIEMMVNTAGYYAIYLSYYSKHSSTAANKLTIQYLNSSSVWQTLYSYTVSSANFVSYNFNLSTAIDAVNNNTTVRLRIVTDFASSSGYQATESGSNYGTSGSIQYDLLTILGNPIGCGTPATQQATGLRLLKTDNTSAQLTLNRGNGSGCLILCSADGVPTNPKDGTNYLANSAFGIGEANGNAYTVYNTQVNNPATHYFNINGLTAGTKYYVAAYEYSSSGYCYLSPGMVDSFYCNSTVLYPGDVQFVGYDNNVGNGDDAFLLTNLKELKKGTSFQIVNSRYEAGASAGVRTNRWYAGDNIPYEDIQKITLTYLGNQLPPGSIISFKHAARTPSNIRINNVLTNDFSITDNFNIGNLLSGSASEQFFLTQGKFISFGSTAGKDKYSTLDGHVLHGINYGNNWVDFSRACSSGDNPTDRESRLPPDIKCLNLYLPGTSDYGYYQPSQSHSGSQGFLLGQLNTVARWTSGAGGSNDDVASAVYTTSFTITDIPVTANWTGSTGNNWFDCNNWENRYVPDSTADAVVSANLATAIDVGNTLAPEYSSLAIARNLNLSGSVLLNGAAADKLLINDQLIISGTGNLVSSGTSIDTVIVRGSIQSLNSNGLQLSNNSWLGLYGNRQLQPISVSLPGTTPIGVATLSLNNPPGINLLSGGFESLQKLELANGILSPMNTAAFHYLGSGCIISSPVNYYGETDKGWEKSFIDGKMYLRTNTTNSYVAPLGSKQKGVFAPLVVKPNLADNRLYEAGYSGVTHPNTSPADINTPPVTKISTQEYWTLTSTPANSPTNLTLYYTPLSFVGGRGPDADALRDLQIVQFWDSSVNSPRKWRLPGFPVSTFKSGPSVQYGKIGMTDGYYATALNANEKDFTLGSATIINTLPVLTIDWTVQLQGNHTRLSWQARQEAGTAFYTIEKSMDGKNFRVLQKVNANGLPTYVCYDHSPTDGWNYYRLKTMGIDGKLTHSTIEKIWFRHAPTFAAFPNPASDQVFVSLPSVAKATISLYASNGSKVREQVTTGSGSITLSVKGLPAGWYLLEYLDGHKRSTQKLFVK